MYSIAQVHPTMAHRDVADTAGHAARLRSLLLVLLAVLAALAANVHRESLAAWLDHALRRPGAASLASPTAATATTTDDLAGAEPAAALSPSMKRALDHVARRYRVAPATLVPVFATIQDAARERRLDPLLVVAVIAVESGFNPIAESPMGAQGLMQVIPRFHLDKVPEDAGENPFLDPVTNVRIGTHVLQEAIRMRGDLVAGLQQYGGSSDPQAAYAARVLAERDRIEQAVAPRLASASRP